MEEKNLAPVKQKWKCERCGSCCKMAGCVSKEFDSANGICKFLRGPEFNESGNAVYFCAVYQTRPEICRTNGRTDEELFESCKIVREFINKRELAHV
jgi:Fe-S-cluster containining protein